MIARRLPAIAFAAYALIFVAAFLYYGLPQSFQEAHSAPALSAVEFKDLGPLEHSGAYYAPAYETECIRATGECRTIFHPLRNPLLATVCRDPNAPGGVVFYNRADRYCE